MPKTKKKSVAQKLREERQRNKSRAESYRIARQDPEFRTPEKKRDANAHREARQDPEFRTPEKKRDANAHREARQDPEKRQNEQMRNTDAHREARQDPEKRQNEQMRNTDAHREARQDPEFRTPEKKRDANAHREARQDHVRKNREQISQRKAVATKRSLFKSNYEKLLDGYQKKIRQPPSFICSCCGTLRYEESTKKTSLELLEAKGCTSDFVKSVLHVKQNQHRFCNTCKGYIDKFKIPKLSLSNGFDFPEIPNVLKVLSPLEERVVSPRLPFLQIRELGHGRQCGLRRNVVNVENDLDICAQVLPRTFDDTSTVQVQLMRRLRDKTPYLYETIRPKRVYDAAKYLIGTELYQEEGVTLSDDWQYYEDDATMNFICMENDEAPPELDDIEESTHSVDDENNVTAEETLIYQEKDLSFCGIRIAPGEGRVPVPIHRDLNAEVLSFPTIYGGMGRKFKENLRVTYTDIAKSELRRYDRRAVAPTKLFYSFKKSFNDKVYQTLQVCMRKKMGGNDVTAANIRTPGFVDSLVKKDEGYAVFKNLRSSPSYWKEKTKKVLAMVRQLGKCAFFITLSAAETKWTELLVMLMKVVKKVDITEEEAANLTFNEIADLIRSDPVTCMTHFDHRYRALLNLLLKPEGGIFSPYQLEDHFSRIEFQMRGSPHSHGLYWIKDAPIYVEGDWISEQKCINFIDQFITCEHSKDDEMKTVLSYQIHKHSHTCKKKKRGNMSCRFSFPKPPMEETRILTPLPQNIDPRELKDSQELYAKIIDDLNQKTRDFEEDINYDEYLESLGTDHMNYIYAIRSSIKRPTVFLKRSTNAAFINGYNKKLLLAWGANIDFQFVLDTYACARYCVGYILKAEGGVSKLLQRASQEVRAGNYTIQQKLKKYANVLIHGSEISAQEASAFLLGLPNTHCSRQDIFISTAPPNERIGILKRQDELDDLDDESTEVCAKGLLDHYAQRPTKLEDICLSEFASMYNFSKTKKQKLTKEEEEEMAEADAIEDSQAVDDVEISQPGDPKLDDTRLLDGSGHVKKRMKRKLIRFRHYGKHEDPENYYREKLMLFIPWRDEESELLSIDPIQTAEEKKEEILLNSKPFFANSAIDDELLTDMFEDAQEEESQMKDTGYGSLENDIVDSDEEEFHGTFTEDIVSGVTRVEQFLPPRFCDNEDYVKLMRSLNDKQRRIVMNELHLTKTSDEPFYHFLSGGAGVGKSHAIMAIVQSWLRYYSKFPTREPDQICVIVSAPTGKAAFNVFGMTLHCAFKLRPNQSAGKLCNLEDGEANNLRLKLNGVKLFIIDEISMVSVRQLYDIDQRLRQIYATSDPFGGKSVIVVGHLRQLAPIGGTYAFKPPSHLPLGNMVGNYLWEKFQLFELDEIMRQHGEAAFCKALNNMSEGTMDEDDIELIKSREISDSLQPPSEAVRLCTTNEECQFHNDNIHKTLKTEGALSVAFDRVQGASSENERQRTLEYAKTLGTLDTVGMPYKTHLQVSGLYFVSTNIDVSDGIFNGSTGTLKMIDYGTTSQNERIPKRAWIDFKNPLIGVTKRASTKQYQQNKSIDLSWVAVDRITKNLCKRDKPKGPQIIRTQIPLVAANAMTIMKAQGSSMSQVVVAVKPFRKANERLTRKLSRELLYVACSRATSLNGLFIDGNFIPPALPGPNDPVTLEMQRLRNIPFNFTLKFLQDYGAEYQKLFFHNVQSFYGHQLDVQGDQCAMSSDILAFVEPHLLSSDIIQVKDFKVIHRTNCNGVRNSEGALVLSKDGGFSTSIITDNSSPGHCLFVTFKTANVTCVMTYKSPKFANGKFISKLSEVLASLQGDNLVVFGDTNIDLQKPEGQRLLQVFDDFNLNSKLNVEQPSTDGGTHIDCCFSNVGSLEAWFNESYFSYHKPICMIWPKHL